MVPEIRVFLFGVAGLISLGYLANHLYWWQIKEYRLDRMLTWVVYDRGFKELLSLKNRRPTFTLRIVLITFFALIFLAAFMLLVYPSPYWIFASLALPEFTAFAIALSTAVSTPLTNLLARQEINQAKKQVATLRPKIIAITGSFGKSSSKEFLATLLGSSYAIVTTQKSENTPLGIARRINSSLREGTDILILEMGAYKRGEISALTDIAAPNISWITAIGPQHIGLFGGLENIKLAKYEVVRALGEEGSAVISVDSADEKDLVDLAKKENVKILTYSLKNKPATLKGTITEKTDRSFKLTVTESENEWSVTVPLRGIHYAGNVLGAIAIARHLKINRDEITARISNLKKPPRQLTTKKLGNGVTLIDNSYNTNLQGFAASVMYLKTFPGRHFIVTPGIIELGKYSQKIHHELGKKLESIDRVWVTNLKHAQEMSSKENDVMGSENINQLFDDIRDTIGKGDTLLIEGRISEGLKSKILKL